MSDDSTAADSAPTRSRFQLLLEAVSDRLNPILVKETRQALKSRQFTLWFVLLLVSSWVATFGAIAMIGPSIFYVSAGAYLLYVYYVILALPLVVVVPFSAYRSLSSEHEENTRDLLEVSSLTPRQVLNGKLGSAMLQAVIYLSALAPCIAFTYLLRGVELIEISLLLVYAVLASFGLSAVGLLLAAISGKKYAQVVISVALAGGLFASFAGLLTVASQLMKFESSELRSDEFWWTNAAVFSLYATTLLIVYAGAESLTTFTSANRSTNLRRAVLVQQSVFVAWVAGLLAGDVATQVVELACLIATVYWFVVGAALTGEQPSLSLRVRRSLPQSLLGRAFGTWFNPGSASGYVFAVANIVMCSAAGVGAVVAVGGPASVRERSAKAIALMAAYAACYLGIGRLVVSAVRRVTEVSMLGCFLIQVLCLLAGSGLPFVVDTATDTLRVADMPSLTFPSPTWNVPKVGDGDLSAVAEDALLVTVGSLTLVVVLSNLVAAGKEARQLRIAKPKRIVEDDRELNPEPEPQPTNPWGDLPEATVDPAN